MKKQSFFASIGLFLFSVLLIISCNKPIDIVSENTSVPTSEQSAPNGSQIQIKLGYSNWPGYMPWLVAEKEQLFRSKKAVIQHIWYDEYLQGLASLISGQVNANSQTLIDTVISAETGTDQVVVLVNDNSTGNDKIIAKSGINNIADLKGKLIAVEKGTVDHYLVLLALEKAGLKATDVKFEFMETKKAADFFASGKADATAVFAPFTNIALKKPGSKELVSSKDFPGSISDVLAFRRSFVAKNPEAVQAVVNSWFDTLEYIKTHQAVSNKIMADKSGVSVAEYVEFGKGLQIFSVADNLKAFQAGKDRSSLAFSAAELKQGVVELGLVKKAPDISKLFDDRFVQAYAAKHKS